MITTLIPKRILRIRQLIGVAVAMAMIAAGCSGTEGEEPDTTTGETTTTVEATGTTVADTGADADQPGLTIVATTSIWGDVVSQIVEDDATVEVLIPIGADAHDYQATPQQVAAILGADLVVSNGLGLEENLHAVLESAEGDGANILVLAEDLDPIQFEDEHAHDDDHDHDHENHEDDHEDHDDDHGHDHGDEDPHVWFDPLRVAQAARIIATELAAIDGSIDWESRATAYAEMLEQADVEIIELLSVVPEENRKLVTNHDAFGYFADRYGFEVIGVVVPGGSTLADPSSAQMAALVEEIRHEGVTTIFAETSQPTALAEAVAGEVGSDVSVVELFSESLGEPGSGADTLIGMLMTNASLIADALTR
jgi:zinc/manganese transport system substrate-binding protein